MLDFQKLVDDVRTTLASGNTESLDLLRAEVADLGVACDEVNARLRQCGKLLAKGLRSEAIQLCEQAPHLLDVVATLDFPDRPQLAATLAQFGIATPPDLLHDIAGQLNEAYALLRPLETLLKRQRLLALSRSPLQPRLEVLRALAELDSDNNVWREDVATFERARCDEIQRESMVAAQASDGAALQALIEELHTAPWSVKPPAALVGFVGEHAAKLANHRYQSRWQTLGDQLQVAYQNQDAAPALKILEEARRVYPGERPLTDAELPLAETPARAWILAVEAEAKTDLAFTTACKALERMLIHGGRLDTIERQVREVQKFARPLPAAVDRQYQDCLNRHRRNVNLRRIVAGSAVTLTVVLVVWGVAAWRSGSLRSERIIDARQRLGIFLAQNKPAEARHFVDGLGDSITGLADDLGWQELITRLEGGENRETKRLALFKSTLARAGQADNLDLRALAAARELAVSPEEKSAVEELQIAADRAEQASRRALDGQIQAELATLEKNLAAWITDAGGGTPAVQSLNQLQDELAILRRKAGSQTAIAPSLAAFGLRLDGLREKIRGAENELRALDGLSRTVGDPQKFVDELTKYARTFPGTARAAEFARSVDEAPLWLSLDAWNKLISRYRGIFVERADAATLTLLRDDTKKMLDEHPGWPQADAIQTRYAFLLARLERGEGHRLARNELLPLYRDRLLRDIYVAEHKQGIVYYSLRPLPEIDSFTISYVTSFALDTKTVKVDRKDLAFTGKAPHCELTATLQTDIVRVDKDWEEGCLHLLNQIHAAEGLDPIIRYLLFSRTLDIAVRGSSGLNTVCHDLKTALDGAGVDTSKNWINPKEDVGKDLRKKAEAVLVRYQPERIAQGLAAEFAKVRADVSAADYRFVGWLRKTDGTWSVAGLPALTTGALAVMVRTGPAEVSILPVGQANQGNAQVDAPEQGALQEGRPVFLAEPPAGRRGAE